MSKKTLINNKIIVFFAVILLTNLLVGAAVLARVDNSLDQKISNIKEEQRPANLDIVVIEDSDCQECFDFNGVLETIKGYNVNILSEKSLEFGDQEAQVLIKENNIKSIPSLIVKGELNKDLETQKLLSQLGKIVEDKFVSTRAIAPYLSLSSGQIIGKVTMVMLTDDNCTECYNVEIHKKIMDQFGVYVADEESISIQTSRGRQMMEKYNINLLPTIILTGDVSAYSSLNSVWPKIGTKESDGAFILRDGVKGMGAYKDMVTNETVVPNTPTKN